MNNRQNQESKAKEWQRKLLYFVAVFLIFETLTGLSIYLLPFNVSNQIMVLLHTVVGLIFIIPYAWYQIRHWLIYRSMTMSHIKLTGYISMVITIVAAISGLILTFQSLFQTRISYAWDQVHDEAEKLEHVISEEFEDKMAKILGNPTADPHGAPIPSKDGEMEERTLVPLTSADAGQKVLVKQVSDNDPEMLRYLGEIGIFPEVKLHILEKAPFGGPLLVQVGEGKHHLGATVTDNDPAIHLSGLGQNWRSMHLIAFSEGLTNSTAPNR